MGRTVADEVWRRQEPRLCRDWTVVKTLVFILSEKGSHWEVFRRRVE